MGIVGENPDKLEDDGLEAIEGFFGVSGFLAVVGGVTGLSATEGFAGCAFADCSSAGPGPGVGFFATPGKLEVDGFLATTGEGFLATTGEAGFLATAGRAGLALADGATGLFSYVGSAATT